jgi:hypothetical protein
LNKLVVVFPTSMDVDNDDDDDDVGVDGGGPEAFDQGVEDDEEDDDDVDGEENGDDDNEAAEMGKSLKRKRQVKIKEQKKKMPRKGRPKGTPNKKGTKPKKESDKPRYRWTKDDDANLCKAWKSISQHPITGTNQTGFQFCTHVADAYNELERRRAQKENDQPILRKYQALIDRF